MGNNKKRKEQKEKRRNANKLLEYKDYDDTFAFIAGYTEGGAPYGITYEEIEDIEKECGRDRARIIPR